LKGEGRVPSLDDRSGQDMQDFTRQAGPETDPGT
jgi:hypothetical protein